MSLDFALIILGISGILVLITLTGILLGRYRECRMGSFRWYQRNYHLKRLTALASLFFLAMAASYAVLQEVWAIVYLIIAFQTGAWWLRFSISQRP